MKRKEAIKRTREGVIQVFNDYHPSTKEIKKFLKEAFPDDDYLEKHPNEVDEISRRYFQKASYDKDYWVSSNGWKKNLPIIGLSTITKRKKTKLNQLERQFSDLAKDVSELRQSLAKDVEVDVEEVKSELIVGEWYKNEKYGYIFCFNGKYEDFSQYGISIDGKWKNNLSSNKNHLPFMIKATPQEVQTSLENVLRKEGFKKAEIQQETIKEEEIDFSVPQLLIYEKEERFVLMTNGISKDEYFEACVVLDEKKKSGWEIGIFSDKWIKDCFKPFKGELTIK